MRKHVAHERGDTLIEVLIAVAILSLATVMTMSVVNNSHREILAEINRETVRSEISSQAELIQYFHDMSDKLNAGSNGVWTSGSWPEEVELWNAIRSQALDNPDQVALNDAADTCGRGHAAFYLALGTAKDNAIGRVLTEDKFQNDAAHTDARYYVVVKLGGLESLRSSGRWSAKPGNGMWINAVHRYTTNADGNQVPDDPNDYYDFYIKACWLSTNSSEDRYSLLIRVNQNSTAVGP